MRKIDWKALSIPALAACAMLGGRPVTAQDAPAAPAPTAVAAASPGAVEPKAREVVGWMSSYLDSQPRLRFLIQDTVDREEEDGSMQTFSHKRTVTVQRPDKLRMDVVGDLERETVVYDGKTITISLPLENLYAKTETAPSINAMLDDMSKRYGVTRPAADLAREGLGSGLLTRVESGKYLGIHRVLDEPCHHIAFTTAEMDWQVWIREGEVPTPRKVQIHYKNLYGEPRYTMLIQQVETPGSIAPGAFTLNPPKDAEEIPFASRSKAGKETK